MALRPAIRSAFLHGALLLASICALVPGALFRGENFFARDLAAYHRPLKSLIRPLTAASSGFPLWNPYFAMGQPFAANPVHELFHPLSTLFLILPFEWAFRLQVLLPILLAAASMALLLEAAGRSSAAIGFGSVAWALSGYLLSASNMLPILFAASALPAVAGFALRVLRNGRRRDVAGLAVSIGLVGLAGEPSTMVVAAIFVPALSFDAFRCGAVRRRTVFRRLAPLSVGLLLGFALGAAALVPGIDHARKTMRVGGLPEAVADLWSLPPVRAVELVAPRFFGRIDLFGPAERYWDDALYPTKQFPFYFSLYPGLIVTVLALATAVLEIRRRWILVATAILGFLLACGNHFPIWHAVRNRIPGFSGLRYPEKFVLITALALLLLAAEGFENMVAGRGRYRRLSRGLLVATSGLALSAAIVVLTRGSAGAAAFRSWGVASELTTRFASRAPVDLAIVALSAAFVVPLIVRPKAGLLTLLTAIDLVLAGRPLVPTKSLEDLTRPPFALRPLVASPALLYHAVANEDERSRAIGIANPPIPVQWGIPTALEKDFDLTELAQSHRASAAFLLAGARNPDVVASILKRRGVRAVLRWKPPAPGEERPPRSPYSPDGPLELIAVKDSMPIAFCASEVRFVRGEEGWLEEILKTPRAPGSRLILDAVDEARMPFGISPGRVSGVRTSPGHLELEVQGAGPLPSLVAINQSWDEGWRAIVDRRPSPLLVSDLSLLSLVVGPGPHRVELTYENRYVTVGVVISLAAAAIVVLLAATARPPRPAG